jgi:redox-sensitive bicupin YhaK (pirin superfamily)
MYKTLYGIIKASAPHMVGDGFPVVGYINSSIWHKISPFLMLDYILPKDFFPTDHPRGVDVHPHKGFETVSILWEGVLAHEDSTGAKGTIHAGDVQWMTAGSGILHKEFHEKEFSKKGGRLHGAQLWINLPAKHKQTKPGYQDIPSSMIPRVFLEDNKSFLRIIAGEQMGVKGPAKTYTRINIFDIHLAINGIVELNLPAEDHAALLVLNGTVQLNDETIVRTGEMAVFETGGTSIKAEANNESHLLLLSGEPIDEPIAAYGPFVMNTQEEIRKALSDYQTGAFGYLT